MEDKEYNNTYAIPANYTDSGQLLGGMLNTRNTVEAVILVALVGYPEAAWLPVSTIYKVVIMVVTLLPLGVFALIGIGGDSLLQFFSHMVCFWLRRRKLHYRRIGYRYGNKIKRHGARKPKARHP